MVLGGLWHGAGIGFVLWGTTHGLFLAIHRAVSSRRERASCDHIALSDVPRIIGTFHLVGLAWIFFRSSGWGQAARMFEGLVHLDGTTLPPESIALVLIGLVTMFGVDILQRRLMSFDRVWRIPPVVRATAYAVMILGVLVWSGGTARPFIYFQF
jgi:D-alanyl-lipoteichoic acid acyltransferase DltB (MBOAT superfamily)